MIAGAICPDFNSYAAQDGVASLERFQTHTTALGHVMAAKAPAGLGEIILAAVGAIIEGILDTVKILVAVLTLPGAGMIPTGTIGAK